MEFDSIPATVAAVLGHARDGYAGLLAVAETIEDEWSETNELATAWQDRFDELESGRGNEPVDDRIVFATRTLVAESASIDDPHRAIDWLSTFPQVLLIALGEQP